MNAYHIPVMLNECLEALQVRPDGIYVDATYGGGGYSAAILKKLKGGKLFAFDMDEDAATDLPKNNRFVFILGNFRYLKNYMKYYGIEKLDGIVADLGVSSHHFDSAERGFTYRNPAMLDMRMNAKSGLTAMKVINTYDEENLIRIFTGYGDLKHGHAARIAGQIRKRQEEKSIENTMELVECIRPFVPKHEENPFLSRVFQAIRIEVNRELENLRIFLQDAVELLQQGGRLAVVSYHSLEDRIVKNFMRWGNADKPPQKDVYGRWEKPFTIVTGKPLTPGKEETLSNPRARSARLRIAVKN